MPHHEGCAFERRQPRHRRLHPVAHLDARHQALRRGADVPSDCRLRRSELFQDVVLLALLSLRPRAKQVHRAVPRNAVQPGAEARAFLEPVQLAVALQECFLTTSSASAWLPVIRNATLKTLRLWRSTRSRKASLSPPRARATTAASCSGIWCV